MSRVRYITPRDASTNRLKLNSHNRARIVGPFDKLILKLLKLCKDSEYYTLIPDRGIFTYKDVV